MQLHWSWAVLGAVALGVGLAWWMSRHDEGGPPRAAPFHAHPPAHAGRRDGASHPTDLYRWVDAHGVVNVSNTRPPAGTRYTTVRIDPDQNVVPMNAPGDASTTGAH